MGKRKFSRLFKKVKERGTAVITVTHNLKGFFPLLERIVLIREGRIAFQGSREDYLETGCVPLPPIASMMKELRARGMPVNPAVFTVEDALEEILKSKMLLIENEKLIGDRIRLKKEESKTGSTGKISEDTLKDKHEETCKSLSSVTCLGLPFFTGLTPEQKLQQ